MRPLPPLQGWLLHWIPASPSELRQCLGGARHRLPKTVSRVLEATNPDSLPATPAVSSAHLVLGRIQVVSSAVAFDLVLTLYGVQERESLS